MSTPEDPAISIELDDKRFFIKLKDYRGSDDRKLRQAMGMTVSQAWREAGEGALDALAGLVWVMRLRSEPNLSYDEVADSLSYRSMETIRDYQQDQIEEAKTGIAKVVDLNPEAPGASS